MTWRRDSLPALIAAAVLGVAASAEAQILAGRITGTIVDDAGRPVRGAIVVADNPQATPPMRTSVSDEEGRFGLMGLKSGLWVLLVRAPGHEPVTRSENVVAQKPGPPISVSLVRIPGTARPRTFDEVKSAAVITDLERALKLVDERKFDEAIAVYRGVLERAPTLTSVQLAMARALRAKPDLPQARATLDKLLAAEPGNHRARLELGLTLEQSGESAAAAREFEQIVRDAPDSPVATTAREKLTALGRSAPGL